MRKSLVGILVMGALVSGGLYADITITNNSFETPNLNGGYIYYAGGNGPNSTLTINGWTYANANTVNDGGAGIASAGSGFGPATPIPNGSNVLFLQNVSSASQEISGFQSGDTYTLSFYASERAASTTPQMLTVTIGGTTLFTTIQPPSTSSYALETASFKATDSSDLLTFQGTVLGGDTTVFVDDVKITPEPGYFGLLIAGLLGLTLAIVKRHNVRTARE